MTPVLVALAFAALVALVRPPRARAWLVPAGAVSHTTLVLVLDEGDALTRVVLPLVSVLFLACALYVPAYLRARSERPNRIFCAALLAFLAMMTLIAQAHHLGVLWVAMEAVTLTSAPLLYFDRSRRSLEATWKYLLIGAVGIALALLGSFFLAYSALAGGHPGSLLVEDLVAVAPELSRPWLHSAFIVLFVGYGTKMGLAPLHTWKPDAYGEAPGVVGALLAGGLTTCAFVALLRFTQICVAAGAADFARDLMLAFGLLSIVVAAVFIGRQRELKRMLAYSSVEHMGILVLGVGIGGLGTFGALLHLVANALVKGVLFLCAGNLQRAYGGERVTGALRRVPVSAALFLAGFFAITGSPPFVPFISELTILRAAFQGGHVGVAAAVLVLLFVIFVAMGRLVLGAVQGPAPAAPTRESLGTTAPPALLLGAALVLGIWLPPPLADRLAAAAALVDGARP